jgi:GNAT superfamily N-acetyltransferase
MVSATGSASVSSIRQGLTRGVKMSDDVGFSISQFGEAWRLLCGASPGYVADRTAAVDYIFTGLPIPFFNVALVTARDVSGGVLQTEARQACEWAAPGSVPWMFVVTHDALAAGVDATSVLDSCGLTPMLPMTGMRAQRVAPATRFPDGLLLDVPRDEESYAAVFDVNAAAYGVSLDACKPTYGTPAFWNGHVPALGRVGGRPVASAAVFMVDGYRYVALVATMPEQQRRGYAEAVMRHALDVAAATYGEKPTFLHATDAGRPVYARMGYEPVASHTAFIEKRFLEGH